MLCEKGRASEVKPGCAECCPVDEHSVARDELVCDQAVSYLVPVSVLVSGTIAVSMNTGAAAITRVMFIAE